MHGLRGEIEVFTTLRNDLARKLLVAAKERAVEPVELLADIVETVLGENLIDAVLDDK